MDVNLTSRSGGVFIPRMAMRAASVPLFLLLAVSAGLAQRDEAEREKQERVADILVALDARDGARVADLGSADGFYALRIARAVAPSGRAYAVDIDAKALDRLRERAKKDEISNVEVILGDVADPKLPAGEIDAVLIRNAYHEMPEYRSILAAVAKSLKAGGVLVVIEAIRDKNRTLSREAQVKEHEIAPEIVESELRDAGFEIVERQDAFTTFTRPPPGSFWMIRARRPGGEDNDRSDVAYALAVVHAKRDSVNDSPHTQQPAASTQRIRTAKFIVVGPMN